MATISRIPRSDGTVYKARVRPRAVVNCFRTRCYEFFRNAIGVR